MKKAFNNYDLNPSKAIHFLNNKFIKFNDKFNVKNKNKIKNVNNNKKNHKKNMRNIKNKKNSKNSKNSKKKFPIVLIIDEIDGLLTKSQAIIYNLLEWSQHENSFLSIIGISNLVKFSDLLKSKIASRLGHFQLIFHPYTLNQIEKIIHAEVEGFELFENESISILAKKIFQKSSDIRRCFEVLKHALFSYQNNTKLKYIPNTNKIGVSEIIKSYNELFQSQSILGNLKKIELIILASIFIARQNDFSNSSLRKSYQVYDSLCLSSNFAYIDYSIYEELVYRLQEFGLVKIINDEVHLTIDSEELVTFVESNDEYMQILSRFKEHLYPK